MFTVFNNTWIFLFGLAILGLIVGSFLNVVIYRLPIILKRIWKKECLNLILEMPNIDTKISNIFDLENETTFNLAIPKSHCPKCNTPLKIWQNIPIVSYLLLFGRCATCKNKISFRYPIVEILSAIIAVIAGIEFGASFTCLAACIFGWFLIVISFIDTENQLIPNAISIPLLWIGLLLSSFELFANCHDAILGAIIGYVFLWSIGKLFLVFRKKEGIGMGDCKLLSAIGAWLGWQLLPFVILTSSILGLIVGLFILSCKKISKDTPIPFAPFIVIAAWIAIIWGFDATHYYLYLFGIDWTNV